MNGFPPVRTVEKAKSALQRSRSRVVEKNRLPLDSGVRLALGGICPPFGSCYANEGMKHGSPSDELMFDSGQKKG